VPLLKLPGESEEDALNLVGIGNKLVGRHLQVAAGQAVRTRLNSAIRTGTPLRA